MSGNVYDRGSAVVIEFTTKKYTPFVGFQEEDPTSTPKVYITAPNGELVVNGVNAERASEGKYFYVCQTDESWSPGAYSVKVTADLNSNKDVTIKDSLFALK